MDRHVLPGSHHEPHPDHQPHSKCHPHDRVEVTVWLRPGSWVSDADRASDLAEVSGLDWYWNEHANNLVFSGSVAAMESAFGVELHHLHHPDGNLYRGHLGPISVPAELKDVVTGVFGLDDRPVAKSYHRFHFQGLPRTAHAAVVPPGCFTPPQLAKLYDFPKATGEGQTIAIIELGGGFKPKDLATYFAEIGVSPAPSVSSVSVDGGKNAPTGNPDGPDGEVMLDIEVAGAIAPAAKIVCFFAPNTDRGFMDAVARAIYDHTPRPSVISISWGGPEDSWTTGAKNQFNSILEAGRTFGVTITVASGDSGSSDGESGNHVDFPASSPYVLACGGTRLTAKDGVIASEVVWNDGPDGGSGGGGYSKQFHRPYFQNGHIDNPMRGVPDVCANASPVTGYYERTDSQDGVIGGTSAVSPFYAALVALINQSLGRRVGFINGHLSKHPEVFRDITSGNNGAYSAKPGWDACSGWGSIIGSKLLESFK